MLETVPQHAIENVDGCVLPEAGMTGAGGNTIRTSTTA